MRLTDSDIHNMFSDMDKFMTEGKQLNEGLNDVQFSSQVVSLAKKVYVDLARLQTMLERVVKDPNSDEAKIAEMIFQAKRDVEGFNQIMKQNSR